MSRELLVSISKTEYIKPALAAGADAVCIRYRSFFEQYGENFYLEMDKQLAYVHSLSKRLYFSFDFFSHNEDIEMIKDILYKMVERLREQPDAIIVYDPGVFNIVKKIMPRVAIHVASAMNVTNDSTCDIWKKLGAARIEFAHVLSADAIELIAKKHVEDIELAAFVYGIPCISYSGRQLLSGFLEECKFIEEQQAKYFVMEEQRQGEYYMVEQDNKGTYVYDSKTRNWLHDIKRLSDAGVSVFSIEGMTYDDKQLVEAVVMCRTVIDSI